MDNLLPEHTRAQFPPTSGGWIKYEGNPVLGNDKLGTCFDVYVIEDGGEYRMYFSWRPKKSLAVVTGTDGIHWSEPRIILEPNPDSGWELDLNRNCVVKRDNTYHMWYTGQCNHHAKGSNSFIGYATSPDGYDWRRMYDQPVLFPERPFEGESVMNPCVLWDDSRNVWRMWYSAGESYEPNVFGYAESQDGFNWMKRAANPIFTANPHLPYEQERVGGCQLLERDGWFYLFYIGYEDIDTARICIARSPDGLTRWQRSSANPIVSPTPGSWDANACYKPSVIWQESNNRWLLWYNGRNLSAEYVGLVTHDGYDLGFGD
ncbi:hypothetical protein FACS1894184_04290 [Clostridia bacterium]|nr:hypothetical protein FACS1894184_04290 [Clostridia bacterium]